jgi:Flp pilus assembly protein protease CpaA
MISSTMFESLLAPEHKPWILIALVLFVAQRDLRHYKITNVSVLVTLLAGLAWNTYFLHLLGLQGGLLGILIGGGILLPLYALGGLTAGDVKWQAALGAWYGPKAIIGVFLVSGVILGLISLLWLILPKIIHRPPTPTATPNQPSKTIDEIFDSSDRRSRLIPYALPVGVGVVLIESIRLFYAAF